MPDPLIELVPGPQEPYAIGVTGRLPHPLLHDVIHNSLTSMRVR